MAEKTVLKNEVATTRKDIDVFAGWLQRLTNPDPVIRSEGGNLGLKLYDDAARDAHASSVLHTRYLSVAGCEWEVTPVDEDAKSVAVAEFVTETLNNLNLTQGLSELMRGVLYGFYVLEVIWGVIDGRFVPARLIGKHPRRFSFTLDRELRLLTPQNMLEGEELPDRKFICFTYGNTDNPYGEGLGQKIWWPVWFKKHGIKYWLIFLEKFGMPTGVGKYPPGTDPADQAKLLDAIDAIQTETGIAIPDTMQVELLEASRTGNVTYEALCDYMDRQISKAVLGQTLTTEVKGDGSYAASKTHDEVRQDLKKSDADLVAEAINATLVRWIVDYNFSGVTEYPALWLRTDPEADLKALAERDKILTKDIGVKVGVGYFRDTYGLPEPEGDEETVGGVKPAADSRAWPAPTGETGNDVGAGHAGDNGNFAETSSLFPDQTAIDRIANPDSGVMDPVLKPVMDLIRQGKSFEEIENNLLDKYPDMNAAQAEKIMERAIFVSELWGRLNSK